jgi:5-methyltetrahydropteroyltriglutamate--homocysteine methyltransferase
MSAASPGVVSLFFRNDYYKDHESYLFAIADAMRHEYERSPRPGSCCRSIAPISPWAAHPVCEPRPGGVPQARRHAHRGARPRALRIAPEQVRMHLCWGNYEGPHHCDVPLADIIDLVLKARPHAISFEAANPRHAHEWTLFERVKLPDGKVLIPGVIESKSNFIEHPELVAQRIGRYARLVGREKRASRFGLRLRHLGRTGGGGSDVVWAKFAAMAEGARIATREFWR